MSRVIYGAQIECLCDSQDTFRDSVSFCVCPIIMNFNFNFCKFFKVSVSFSCSVYLQGMECYYLVWTVRDMGTCWNTLIFFTTGLGDVCERDTECVVPDDLKQEMVWCWNKQCICKAGWKREDNRCGKL